MKADVAVIGAGPAGSVIAMTLVRQGLSVVLIERSDGTNFRVGESLPPAARSILKSLGLLDRMLTSEHKAAYANRSAWGTDELISNDFIFNEDGHGWHIDRRAFDQMLTDAAAERGASIFNSTRCVSASPTPNGWLLNLQKEKTTCVIEAGFVCDCTGRAATFAQKQGAQRVAYDNLIAVVYLLTSNKGEDIDTSTLVESVESGWWYTSLLPDGRRIAVYHTDNDLMTVSFVRSTAGWLELYRRTIHVRKLVEQHSFVLACLPWIVGANSSQLDFLTGDKWLAAGDAAASFDPLSSQGIISAMVGGKQAAAAILDNWRGNTPALNQYCSKINSSYRDYLRKHSWYYRQERRWPNATFWGRRQAQFRRHQIG